MAFSSGERGYTVDIHTSFPTAVSEKLRSYVYLLIDPDTGKPFYVGKGTSDRIFAHVDEADSEDIKNAKLERIRAIRERGQEVLHVIHRHGLTEKEAYEVEAALIDFIGLPELTNLVGGHHSSNYGPMTIDDIIESYAAPEITIQEPAILVIINRLFDRNMSKDELYDAARGDWVVGAHREKAQYVFAVSNGIVREVYKVKRWYPAESSGDESKTQQRWCFDGHVAKEMHHYVGGSVEEYVKMGAQNPVRYVNC
jgi:hypothetical protein